MDKKHKVFVCVLMSLALHTITLLIMVKSDDGNKVILFKKNVEVTLVNIKLSINKNQ